MVFLSPVVKRG
ncbi:hypothetical protein D1010_09425 [Schleiferilactobacillus harbinensis]|uniref:Uncharacterized protein n=1 Tax=Schleiferilactobacillus harbinensis TaxID=304207 RepID=A0A5P8MA81_9LACO|nr:hypothetical protein D1010_09425 [Schleiferilactobacillus harbinensis]